MDLGISVTGTPTVTAQVLYRELDQEVKERASLNLFASNQEATLTKKNTITTVTHTQTEKM
jgi:hypothetical protein